MDESTMTANAKAAAAAFLAAAAPGDALEAMLIEQMAAVHEAAMRCLTRAAETAEHPQIEALYLRAAARLLHLFQRQSDALDRRRMAAEDRAEERARTERLEESSWRQEKDHARRAGLPAPSRPPHRAPAWPEWPERAEANGREARRGRKARGRDAKGKRGNGAAPPS